MFFFHFSYTIDLSNQNYIHAITTYNQHGLIQKVDGQSCMLQVTALPELVEEAKQSGKEQITIEVMIGNSFATCNIFPLFKPKDLLQSLDLSQLNKEKVLRNAQLIINYRQVQDLERDCGIAATIPEPILDELTRTEALFILTKLHEHKQLAGAIHWSALQTIVFQTKDTDKNYLISYGQQSSIVQLAPISFSLESGFIDKFQATPRRSLIIQELQKIFLMWKNNNYLGPLIKDSQAGFIEDILVLQQLASVNSKQSFLKFRLELCNSRYNLMANGPFLQCIKELYRSLELHPLTHDFFEYSLFYASGCLDFVKNLIQTSEENALNLRFYHSFDEGEISLEQEYLVLYLGIRDAKKIKQLEEFSEILLNGMRANIDKEASKHSCYKQPNKWQFGFIMRRIEGFSAFLNNPLLLAKDLIAHEAKIKDKTFISKTCLELKTALSMFKDLPNGPKEELLRNLYEEIKLLYKKYNLDEQDSSRYPPHPLFQKEKNKKESFSSQLYPS